MLRFKLNNVSKRGPISVHSANMLSQNATRAEEVPLWENTILSDRRDSVFINSAQTESNLLQQNSF